MNWYIIIFSFVGFALSLYGYITEMRLAKNPFYKPACDINELISCSKAFNSPYGALVGISNTLLGMGYYLLVALLALLGFSQLLVYLTGLGILATIVFAYLLYIKVQSLCLVCTATYVVNIGLFVSNYM